MLFKQQILDKIAAGEVKLAFRRWKRPTVKPGSSLQTSMGVLRILTVETIRDAQLSTRAAKQAGFNSVEELLRSLGDREGELYRIAFERVGDDPRIKLRANDKLSPADVEDLQTRLARLDIRSQAGPWTTSVLQLIAKHPELRAVELAARSRFEKEWLKTNIRKLKNLGLTESLEVGYQLSPRGRAFLQAISADAR